MVIVPGSRTKCFTICMNWSASACVTILDPYLGTASSIASSTRFSFLSLGHRAERARASRRKSGARWESSPTHAPEPLPQISSTRIGSLNSVPLTPWPSATDWAASAWFAPVSGIATALPDPLHAHNPVRRMLSDIRPCRDEKLHRGIVHLVAPSVTPVFYILGFLDFLTCFEHVPRIDHLHH
jgi:hypothetical protein